MTGWDGEVFSDPSLIDPKVYVVSESGTVRPSELVDTLEAIALLPGGSIMFPTKW